MTQPGVDFGEVIHTARSVDGCHSYLEIEFYDGAQYAATYSSDVGPINLIYYAGQYLMGDDYFFLSSPLFGTISFNADDEGIYMPEGYSVDQGLNSGMRMKFE